MDINSLLLPVSEQNSCGEYLCYEPEYDKLKELRREDDPRLSQGVWQIEPKKANWPELKTFSCKLLQTKTKDLQIAMWLMEALIAEDGFKGLNEGLELIYGLCEKFWDGLYPSIDTENNSYAYRMAPFFFLAEKIAERLVVIPLTSLENLVVYSLADWLDARRNFRIKNTNGLSLQTIGKQVAETPVEVFHEILEQITKAEDNMNRLKSLLNEKCDQESPSFQTLMNEITDIKRITQKNIELKSAQQIQMAKVEQTQATNEVPVEIDTNAVINNEPESSEPTLAQAYSALAELSVFLEEKQPQSPAAMLIKVANHIGKKSFQELLDIDAPNGSILNAIYDLYRITFPKPKEEEEPHEE